MVQLRIYQPGKGFHEEEGLGALPGLVKDGGNVVWAALQAPTDEELTGVEHALSLHPLTIEGLRDDLDRPRIRQYGDALLMSLFFAERADEDDGAVQFRPLHAIVATRVLVTVSPEFCAELDDSYHDWKEDADRLAPDAGAPLYELLDTLLDGYFPVVDAIAERVDAVEDRVMGADGSSGLPEIFALKKGMLRFRRMASGLREVTNTLLRHGEMFDPQNTVFFQDLYDHTVRITDSADTYRDLLGNAMEAHLSVTSNQLAAASNRLNVTMQTLTAWSIILGSGAVITGFYGMNVHGLPGASGDRGVLWAVGLMLFATLALLMVFRKKKWV
jgi:magnesium transporter